MTKVLIADQIKSSLVMTSEVFKDKIPGCIVFVSASGQECLEILSRESVDMIVIDFDLADTDGITLYQILRGMYDGPILLTAYPDAVVGEAIKSELFVYSDVSDWLAKPFKFENLSEKIDHFLFNKSRIFKRFNADIETMLIGKGAGKGKRSPKVAGNIITLSASGALVKLDNIVKMKIGDEVTVSVDFPVNISQERRKPISSKKSTNKKDQAQVLKTKSAKIKAKIAWLNKGKTEAGIQFNSLSDPQRKMLENMMRDFDS
ncbi:MAG: response regulator [Bdellovibrionota bacterium]